MATRDGDSDYAATTVLFDTIPTAALLLRGEHIIAVNSAYERFMGISAKEVEGRTAHDLIGQFVGAPDVPLVGAAAEALFAGQNEQGELWIRVTDATGQPRSIRVDWRPSGIPGDSVIYLVDAEAEVAARATAEKLARAAGELGRCKDEPEVLERAADVLFERGLIVTTLLLSDGDPLLTYGPMRSTSTYKPTESATAVVELRATRPRREVLWELNKDFDRRRAAFFQDVGPLIAAVYPGPLGDRLRAGVKERRTVQAPLFVGDEPYGAIVLTGDELSPALVGTIEMFVELVARAIENVRLRVELIQRERLAALGEAAAVMAHEVRNPIAAIMNARALLQKESVDVVAQRSLLSVIDEEARRLDGLVSDLLDLGRPLTPRVKPVDLHDLARSSVDVLAARGAAGSTDVVVTRPDFPVVAHLDPELAQLALWNVVRNAAQASPKGKRVEVCVALRGRRAALIVDDEGDGFPREHVERLLEPFHTTRATGTGIGLAVVRRVVEACQGSIEIGASPSGGGRFVMLFPADSP
jgi:two-component system, NtrC family, sensor histidine kinase HydH